MKRKVLSVILACAMTLSLAACGNSSADTGTQSEGTESTESTESAGEEASSSDEGGTVIKVYFEGSDVSDDSAVLEEVNKYLNEKIGVSIEPIWGTWSDFNEKSVLALQGGEDIDIYFTSSWTADEYVKFARDGYWVRLDDPDNNLLEEYGKEVWDLLPEVLRNGAMIEGMDGFGVYAIPTYKDIAQQYRWDVNMDLLEKYGYTLADIENTDYYGFGDILKTVKEGEGENFYPLNVEGLVLERIGTTSSVVTGAATLLSFYFNPDDVTQPGEDGLVIQNKWGTDEFEKLARQSREYFLAGYIDPGLSNTNQAADLRMQKYKNADYLLGTQSYAYGYELDMSVERGIHVEMVPCTEPYVDTVSSQGALMAVSTTSKNPEKAVEFLNLLNTDGTLMTMLNYGLEGVHYNLEEGLVKFTEERKQYTPWTNGMGNVTILTETVDQGKGWWDEFKAFYGAAEESPILGYTYNSSEMETEIAAVKNVIDEYSLPLLTGAVDVDEKLPEFLAKLDEAGMQKIVDDANAQLQEFLAAKGGN